MWLSHCPFTKKRSLFFGWAKCVFPEAIGQALRSLAMPTWRFGLWEFNLRGAMSVMCGSGETCEKKQRRKRRIQYIYIWFVKVCKMFIFMIYFFKIIFLRMIFVYLFTYGNGNQNVCRFEVRVFVKPSILPSDIQSDMSTLSEEGVTMHHIIHTWVLNILAYWISSVDWSWIGKRPPNLEEWKLRWCWTDWIWRR